MTFKPKKMFLHSFGNEKIEVLLIVYASVKYKPIKENNSAGIF